MGSMLHLLNRYVWKNAVKIACDFSRGYGRIWKQHHTLQLKSIPWLPTRHRPCMDNAVAEIGRATHSARQVWSTLVLPKKTTFVILAGWCGVQRQGPDVGTLAYRWSNKWISLNESDLFFLSCEFNLTFHPRTFFLKEYFHLSIHWGAPICMQKFVFPRVPPSQVVDQDFSQCVPATAVGTPNCDYVTCVDPNVLYCVFVSMFLEL